MITDVEHILAYHDPEHACNQGNIIRLAGGDLLLGYNEERGRAHSDSGQSCHVRSRDGGRTWDPASRVVVWPWTDHGVPPAKNIQVSHQALNFRMRF